MNNIIQFKNGSPFRYETLTLGDELMVCPGWGPFKTNCVFVKVTRKGFNILDRDTNRMIFYKRHLYGVGMANKEYPSRGPITVKVAVPFHCRISKKKKAKVL